MRGRLTAFRERTHDVRCAVREVKVVNVDITDTFRKVQFLIAANAAAIVLTLAPQHNGNDTNLAHQEEKNKTQTLDMLFTFIFKVMCIFAI